MVIEWEFLGISLEEPTIVIIMDIWDLTNKYGHFVIQIVNPIKQDYGIDPTIVNPTIGEFIVGELPVKYGISPTKMMISQGLLKS